MHSGSFISPKHPAIPVSIGIASIVLEGRPAVIDGGTTTSTSSSSSSSSSSRNAGTDGGGTGPGGGGGGGPDEDGGFFAAAGGGVGGAIGTECHPKSFSMTDAAKRINLKLQQIRSCPGTSKDVVENMVTVEAGAAAGDYDNYGVETYVTEARSSETTPLVFSAKAWSRDHIYSGFEKMKLMGAVSPIKVPPAAAAMSSFINFSGPSTVNSKKKLEVGGGGGGASKQRTREGPHCEQFLKKVGVIKIDPAEEAEHSCSYRNEFCLRWQSYLKQLSSLLTTGEAICIEVYLGPENHAILLEQWILKLKIKSSDSTMTLQSLCAAIRSQLYFSQISAWTDLIKNSLEPEIFNHPRIKKAAVGSGPNSNDTSPLGLPRAKLDILFRIRGYDNTACFNETPNVHNFPDAIVADNYVIEVVLKSLPRLERIPRINDEMDTKMDEALVNDRIDGPCHEKGKHRCTFRLEDEEDPQMGEEDSVAMSHREKQLLKYKKRMMKREKKKKALESGGSTSSVGSNEAVPMVVTPPVCKSPALNIPVPQSHANSCGVPPPYTSSINLIQPPLYSNCDDLYQPTSSANNNNTKATQTAIFLALSSNGTVSTVATQTDASGCCCLCANPQQQPAPSQAPMSTNSDSKMQYINSNNLRRDYTTSSNCDTSQPEVDAVIAAAAQRRREESKGLRKAELLLQAIQRTAIINDHHQPTADDEVDADATAAHFSNNNYYSGSYNDNNNVGSDTAKCERSECDTFTFSKEPLDLGDCRLCKRQKTKHNFKLALSNKSDSESGSGSSSGTSSTNNSPPGCRRTLSESLVGHFTLPSSSSSKVAKHGAVKRDSEGADDDDDGIDDLSEGRLSTSTGAVGTLSFEQLKSYRRAFSEDVIDTISLNGGAQNGQNKEGFQQCGCAKSTLKDGSHCSLFATPHVASRQPPTSTPAAGSSSKAPLFVNCTESDCSVSTASSVSPHKKQILSCTAVSSGSKPVPAPMAYYTIPKINLTNIFNVSPLAREDSGFASTSSPIPIDESVGVFNFSESSRLMVQKSSSAPTCHLSPGSLSPRFLRHAYKHQRSRYLSERSSVSERSSIGSDEQLSEDEYPFLVDSNGTSYGSNFVLSPSATPLSPLKFGSAQQRPFCRSFSKNLFKFGRSPLLGTLEESLLQRRIVPKFQVADFKVLLGASGSFCPTQLTIPVASYFYELPGQHLSTPYVCELRLPRKGYSIPRQGTVQVTLLNPLGTVVRMFVVPYDFRDMPAMSTTFIRQRILAYDESSSAKGSSAPQPRNVEQLSNAEQMKLLRYAIHLRFQTSRSGKLSLHTDIRLLISRRTDCDTAAAHAKNLLEAPNELKVVTIVPDSPKFSQRMDKQ